MNGFAHLSRPISPHCDAHSSICSGKDFLKQVPDALKKEIDRIVYPEGNKGSIEHLIKVTQRSTIDGSDATASASLV